MSPASIAEWGGCLFGIIGASLVALNNRYSGYGFVAFLASNVCLITFGILTNAYGLVTMQIVFTGTSLFGIWRWLIKDRLTPQARLRCRKAVA